MLLLRTMSILFPFWRAIQTREIVILESNLPESLGRCFALSNSGFRLSGAQARTFNRVHIGTASLYCPVPTPPTQTNGDVHPWVTKQSQAAANAELDRPFRLPALISAVSH